MTNGGISNDCFSCEGLKEFMARLFSFCLAEEQLWSTSIMSWAVQSFVKPPIMHVQDAFRLAVDCLLRHEFLRKYISTALRTLSVYMELICVLFDQQAAKLCTMSAIPHIELTLGLGRAGQGWADYTNALRMYDI